MLSLHSPNPQEPAGAPAQDEALRFVPGDILAKKYLIEGLLGSGGMGLVLAARHLDLGQQVAIKILRREVSQNVEAMTRFIREGQAAVRLRSVHAARVLDVGRLESGTPYLVMEHLVGFDLARVIEQRGGLPLAEATEYILQACEALAEAHALGIIHRDLKPANLFLSEDPFGKPLVKVLDFGISKCSLSPIESWEMGAAMTNTSVVMGSPLYMPPEQMRSARDADQRSDIWAMGTILWELLTGQHIWMAETMSAVCMRVATEPTPSLREFRPDLPGEVDVVLDRCLRKDPACRFQSVLELARALKPFAGPTAAMAIERISHFSGLGTTDTVASATPGQAAVASAGRDSAEPARTPASPRPRRGWGKQPAKTFTPDTWLSGSDANLGPAQHLVLARRIALPLALATLIGVSWFQFRPRKPNLARDVTPNPRIIRSEHDLQPMSATVFPMPPASSSVLDTVPAVSPLSERQAKSTSPMTARGRQRGAAAKPSQSATRPTTDSSAKPTPSLQKANALPQPSSQPPVVPDWGGRR